MSKSAENELIFICRVCLSENTKEFKINHYGFPGKDKNWKSFFCFDCGSVSDYREKKLEVNYTDNTFRNRDYFNLKYNDHKVLPPIDPWSIMSFGRWEHIYKFLNKTSSIFSNKEIRMLDFGGFNGFLPYAFSQKNNIISYVADLNPKALNMAKFLGSETINLKENKIEEKNFDLITIVHVLEHLDKPTEQLRELKEKLSKDGLIYAEVPNLYGFPLSANTHKIAFSQQSFIKMFLSIDFKILDFGFTRSPKELSKLGYIYNHDKENLYLICSINEKNISVNLPKNEIPKNIKSFKYKLKLEYTYLMLKNIGFNLIRPSLGYIKKSIIFFIYGLIDLITLKLFKSSIISKIFKQK